ncbi:CotH kinase family protein [Methanimicrococcus blatticola]|uniref:CotH protein n=1 Tax=Methanimicrococcus blatticola TaxID=91560 RepID=A0A484F436_9EURY|nr:CotH kinase family protein [Methanimicrococcus blatticola]MBZ3935618.1 CotH kinase family protein [Methanimicrococcus blatticola]MCC2509259.1 CotH kinase family protein [Methanimicrococcus blatticola]TDQ69376.1 CotH protein [Methanimicrococcus blatticola]
MSASDKKGGFIDSKYLNIVTAVFVVFAVLLVCILMYNPSLLGIQSASAHPDYEDKIFNQSMITSISIDMSEENWMALLENPLTEEFYMANVTINGETFYSVGIRTKGMTSLSQVASSDSDRYSFKLKADTYIDGQTFFGLEEFVINNMYQDPSYMKEYLAYDMMTYMGVASPLFNFADITMNGEPWGLYLAIEVMEEDFAMRVYGSDFGQLYKPETMGMGGGNVGGNRPEGGGNFGGGMGITRPEDGDFDGDFGEISNRNGQMIPIQGNQAMPTASITLATSADNQTITVNGTTFETQEDGTFTEEDRAAIAAAMAEAGNTRQNFGGMGTGGGADLVYTDDNISSYSQIFENAVFKNAKNSDFNRVITALKYLNAGEELETYVDVDHTLRYFAVNTVVVNLDSYVSGLKHNYYLYEKDGQITILPWDYNLAFGAFQSGTASSTVNFPIDTPVSGVSMEDRPLIGVLLAEDEYMDLYHEYLQEIVDEYFNSGYYDNKITELDDLIGEHVKNDQTAFFTYDEYVTAVEEMRVFGELRAESIQGQLDGTVPSTSEDQTANPDALIDASALNMSALGGMGGGMGGGMPGGGGRMQGGNWPTQVTTPQAADDLSVPPTGTGAAPA